MAHSYYRSHHVRLPHTDGRPKPRKRGSGSRKGGGRMRMAKATLAQASSPEAPPISSIGNGIIESHMDDLVEKDEE